MCWNGSFQCSKVPSKVLGAALIADTPVSPTSTHSLPLWNSTYLPACRCLVVHEMLSDGACSSSYGSSRSWVSYSSYVMSSTRSRWLSYAAASQMLLCACSFAVIDKSLIMGYSRGFRGNLHVKVSLVFVGLSQRKLKFTEFKQCFIMCLGNHR